MKPQIIEIYLLRSISCLAIVFMHSISLVVNNLSLDETTVAWLDSFRMALMFGTPMFIFISEFVLGYSYPEAIPKGFLKKRFMYVFLPLIFMSFFYAGFESIINDLAFNEFVVNSFKNLFYGSFHGYFILIIFQFYILHIVLVKYVIPKFSPIIVITTSVTVNVLYLALFNFTDLNKILYFIPGIEQIWSKANTLPFLAWIGYFAVAYYCGREPEKLIAQIKTHKIFIILITIITFSLVQYMYHSKLLDSIYSKRVDVLLFTFSLFFLIYYIGSKMSYVPKMINVISQYSFGIYLLHPFFLSIIPLGLIVNISITNIVLLIFLAFILGVVLSISATYLLNKLKYGKFIVGSVGKEYKNKNELENKTLRKSLDQTE